MNKLDPHSTKTVVMYPPVGVKRVRKLRILQRFLLFANLLLIAGCGPNAISAGSQRAKNSEAVDLQRFLVLPRPPEIAAGDTGEIASAQRLLRNLSPSELANREGAKFTRANGLPWLTGSTIGRSFLAISDPRVLVRGYPQAFCPTVMVESGPAAVPDLAARALRRCLAQSSDGCGCRVVAAGSVLLVPQRDVIYATGIAARIRARSLELDGLLVAEETTAGTTILRDLKGTVAEINRGEGRAVSIEFKRDGRVFSGEARPVGYRRGRIAERIYAEDQNGNKLSLLIGFDPEELAELAGAWLTWPAN